MVARPRRLFQRFSSSPVPPSSTRCGLRVKARTHCRPSCQNERTLTESKKAYESPQTRRFSRPQALHVPSWVDRDAANVSRSAISAFPAAPATSFTWFTAQADLLCEFGSLFCIIRSHHWVVGRKPPFCAIFLRTHIVSRLQMTLEHL